MDYLSAARIASLPATERTMFDCIVSSPSQDFGSPIINSSASYNSKSSWLSLRLQNRSLSTEF